MLLPELIGQLCPVRFALRRRAVRDERTLTVRGSGEEKEHIFILFSVILICPIFISLPDGWCGAGGTAGKQGICDIRWIDGGKIQRHKMLMRAHNSNKVQLENEMGKKKEKY